MESRKSSRKPAPTCPSKCLQVYSWNCCLAGMPRKFEETPGLNLLTMAARQRAEAEQTAARRQSPVYALAMDPQASTSATVLLEVGFTNCRSVRVVTG